MYSSSVGSDDAEQGLGFRSCAQKPQNDRVDNETWAKRSSRIGDSETTPKASFLLRIFSCCCPDLQNNTVNGHDIDFLGRSSSTSTNSAEDFQKYCAGHSLGI